MGWDHCSRRFRSVEAFVATIANVLRFPA